MLGLSDLSWMQAWGILESDRVRNRLLEIHGCVGSRWLGRSLLGVQVMPPRLGVAFSALQQLSPEKKGEMWAGNRSRHRVTEGTAGSGTTQQCGNKGFSGFLSLKHFFFIIPGSGCCQDLQSVFSSGSVSWELGSAVCVVWSRAGGRRFHVPSWLPVLSLQLAHLVYTP